MYSCTQSPGSIWKCFDFELGNQCREMRGPYRFTSNPKVTQRGQHHHEKRVHEVGRCVGVFICIWAELLLGGSHFRYWALRKGQLEFWFTLGLWIMFLGPKCVNFPFIGEVNLLFEKLQSNASFQVIYHHWPSTLSSLQATPPAPQPPRLLLSTPSSVTVIMIVTHH